VHAATVDILRASLPNYAAARQHRKRGRPRRPAIDRDALLFAMAACRDRQRRGTANPPDTVGRMDG
jgi:hypothetical protein